MTEVERDPVQTIVDAKDYNWSYVVNEGPGITLLLSVHSREEYSPEK